MKHTPGPWKAYRPVDSTKCVITSKFSRIAIVEPGENHANAVLIAAAPDLLAALEMVCEVGKPTPAEWGIIRAAIAKATE